MANPAKRPLPDPRPAPEPEAATAPAVRWLALAATEGGYRVLTLWTMGVPPEAEAGEESASPEEAEERYKIAAADLFDSLDAVTPPEPFARCPRCRLEYRGAAECPNCAIEPARIAGWNAALAAAARLAKGAA